MLDEIRKMNSTRSAIRIVTNANHPIRPNFMNPNKLDEYGRLGETQIDIRRIEMSSRYDRPP
jgi:hypothetical protein